jgi:hypothetical protein
VRICSAATAALLAALRAGTLPGARVLVALSAVSRAVRRLPALVICAVAPVKKALPVMAVTTECPVLQSKGTG